MSIFLGRDAVNIQITIGDPVGLLRELSQKEISLQKICFVGPLEVAATVYRKDLSALGRYVAQKGGVLKIQTRSGILPFLQQGKRRGGLLLICLFLFFLTMYIPTRICFIKIEEVDDSLRFRILEILESEHVSFGVSKKSVSNEHLVNCIKKEISNIHWVGIKTVGCVMTVEVQGNGENDAKIQRDATVDHLIASADGIIDSITVTQGTALCREGQAVQKGQVLVSGYEDHGFHLRATQAKGQVIAKTNRVFICSMPTESSQRKELLDYERKVSVKIGKKEIKLYNSSGISHSSCVKMYEKEYVTLPSGLQLPIAIVTEHWYYYSCEDSSLPDTYMESALNYPYVYLQAQMISGEILSAHRETISLKDDAYYIFRFTCKEEIGKRITEEILIDGKHR